MVESHTVLHTKWCENCIWGENGFYNAHCAHCPEYHYSKQFGSSFMTRETAELLAALRGNEDE